MQIELSNDFHGTSIALKAKNGKLSHGQMLKARRELCGIGECTCSGDFGYRGSQDGIDGIDPIYDRHAGRVVGGIVHFGD